MPSLPLVRRRLAAAATLLFVLTACSAGPATPEPSNVPTPTAGPVVRVDLDDFAFVVPGGEVVDGKPALTVRAGTTVTFLNVGEVEHTASDYHDGYHQDQARFHLLLVPGQDANKRFDEPGTYLIGCVPHPGMEMVLIVQ